MIPLRDNIGARRLVSIVSLLLAANVMVFVYEAWLGHAAESLLYEYGMVPARFTHLAVDGQFTALWAPVTLLTSLFLHGDFLHIAGNMLYLYIFGPAVEARFGHGRFFWFYLTAGIAAGLAMVWMQPASRMPVVGASGAIAGVLGAYFVLYPRARIVTMVPFFVFVEIIEVPAVLYLLLWFAVQLYAGLQSVGGHGAIVGGVAWWAHVGGFLFGIAMAPLLARPRSRTGKIGLW